MRPFMFPMLSLLFLLTACATTVGPSFADTANEPFSEWIRPPSDNLVRIRILHSRKPVRIGGNGPWEYRAARGGTSKTSTRALTLRASRHGVIINNKTIKGSVGVRPLAAAHVLSVNGKQYRGRFVVAASKGYLDVIEYVDLDEYLNGVLPREVGSNWPMESLKAQAVISRTYAMANRSENAAQGFDMVNDVRSQVYGGLAVEAPATNQAVSETRGQILVGTDEKPIQAFFHSSCGGFTEKPKSVWPAAKVDETLFASASDSYCDADRYTNWTLRISAQTLRSRLRRAGISVGEIKSIEMSKVTLSGRAETFRVITRTGRRDVQGNRFRLAVGPEALRSTRISEIEKSGTTFIFKGHGWGHGVGLCQWGAKGRASAGQPYQQILEAYYPGTLLRRL